MVKHSNSKKPHTTMRGKIIDMDLLRKKNELTPAVGNVRVNARGDELGPGGKIVRKREEIIKDFYENNPNAVKIDSGIEKQKTVIKPAEEKSTSKLTETKVANPKPAAKPTAKEAKQFEEFDEGWEEDEDGNFVKKGNK